jgi:hypothetical protein
MIPFNPLDPFPLLSPDSHTYGDAQKHSEAVDNWLGLDTSRVEAQIIEDTFDDPTQQLWIGLAPKKLLTPYTEIRAFLDILKPPPGSTLVDLGAGYGRIGFVLTRHYPQVHFIGYEFVQQRVSEGMRCLAKFPHSLSRLYQIDLQTPAFKPAAAELYFLYDFGTREAIEKILQDLKRIAASRSITVVGRGRASRDAIERNHPWLSQVCPPEHHAHSSIYRSSDDRN